MIINSVAWCHAKKSYKQENYREGIDSFAGEVEAKHCVNCSEAEESEEFDVVLECELEKDEPKWIGSDELADFIIEQEIKYFINEED